MKKAYGEYLTLALSVVVVVFISSGLLLMASNLLTTTMADPNVTGSTRQILGIVAYLIVIGLAAIDGSIVWFVNRHFGEDESE